MTEYTGSWFSENGIFKSTSDFHPERFESGIVLYEVLRIQQGVPLFLEDHIRRLRESVDLSGLDAQVLPEPIRSSLHELSRLNAIQDGNIKIIIWYPAPEENSVLLAFFIPHSYPSLEMYETGVDADLSKAVRANPNVKKMHPDLIRQLTAFIKERRIYDALLVDEKGYITEGSKTNFFLVRSKELITAPESMVLKGITRQKILELCNKLDIRVKEELVAPGDLTKFDAAFFSGTSPKILPVRRISDFTFNVKNPVVESLSAAYNEMINQYIQRVH